MRRALLVITAAVVVVASAVAMGAGTTGAAPRVITATSTDWPQFGFNARHSRYNPFERVLRPANVARLRVAWSYRTVGYGVSSPVVAGGMVYVGSGNREVYALDASTGQKLWSYARVATLPDSLGVAGGAVYVDSADGWPYALDASTGHKRWSYFTNGANFGRASPTVANGVVYTGAGVNGYDMTAFNASTGKILLSQNPGKDRSVYASAAVAGGKVYFTVTKVTEPTVGWVYALDASTGHELWSFRTGRHPGLSPAVAGGVVYVGVGRTVYALNASTGHELWSYDARGVIYSSPAVAGGMVYISAARASITMNGGVHGKVYALRASTGHKLWSHQIGAVTSSPAVAGGVVYIVSGTKKVYALDASTGHDLWSYRTGHADGSSPTVVNGKLYIGSGDHKLYAFDLPTNASQPATRPRASRLKPTRSPRPLKGTL